MQKWFIIAAIVTVVVSECPDITPKQDLNLTEYTRATWYIQQQQVTDYLPENSFYCTVAT